MLSLGSLGALFFRGGMVKKTVTRYSGDSFPTYTPNPIFQKAYRSGEVEVEHWSILTYVQRLEAAARGLPAVVTGSLVGSSMAENPDFCGRRHAVRGTSGSCAPLAPDVTLLHAAVADEEGNLALSEPGLEGSWAAWAAKRGVIATVEQVVPSLDGLGHRVQRPGSPGAGLRRGPVRGAPRWPLRAGPRLPQLRGGHSVLVGGARTRREVTSTACWRATWVLEPETHQAYLDRLGAERLQTLESADRPGELAPRRRGAPGRRRESRRGRRSTQRCTPVGEVRRMARRPHGGRRRARGSRSRQPRRLGGGRPVPGGGHRTVMLTAELGMLGYTPTPADPYIFNQRVFPAHIVARRRADGARDGGRRAGDEGHRLPRCGAGRPGREPELDRHPGRPVPRRVRRCERRRQPGSGMRSGRRSQDPSVWSSGSGT